MADDNPTERTTLLDKTDAQSEQVYFNLGYGSRRSSTSSVTPNIAGDHPSLDDLLYRIQFAFLNPSYDVGADVQLVLQDAENKTEIADQLLQQLNATPLPVQKKLALSRLLHKESNKRRYKNQRKIEKRKDLQGYARSWHIWEGSVTHITAYFGTNVASYFRFVRTLVYINSFIALLMIGLTTFPEILSGNFKSDITYGGHFGDLSDSIMFYGAYTNDLDFTFNLPLSYMLTWLAVNLFCFVMIITIMILRYRRSKLSDVGSEYPFSWKTFCTWDHSVTSRAGVIDQRTALKTEIKEKVREEKYVLAVTPLTRYLRYVGRFVSNFLVLAMLGGSGYLIYFIADQDNILPDSSPDWARDLFHSYQLTVVVAGLKVLVPPIFEQLALLEGWHPRIETKLTLVRTTFFYFASLVVFVVSLYEVTDDCYKMNQTMFDNTSSCCWENEVGDEVFKLVLVDLSLFILIGVLLHLTRAAVVKFCCCRRIGYSKFVVVSGILDVIYGQGLIWLGLYFSPLLALIGVIKLIIVFYFRYFILNVAMVPPQQVFRASSTGNFYLAILLLNLFVSLFPMAYAVIELHPSPECGPFRKFDHAYQLISESVGDLPGWLEDILKYVSTPAVVVPLLILFVLHPSPECGPFRKFDHAYQLISESVGDLPGWLEDLLKYISTPAVVVPLLILFVMATLYYKTKSSSYSNLIRRLRKQLTFERRVEKRKIFATGRAMSGTTLNKAYGSQDSLVSAGKPVSKSKAGPVRDDVIEEENEI